MTSTRAAANFLLPFDTDFTEQDVPAVAGECGRREAGRRIGHRGESEARLRRAANEIAPARPRRRKSRHALQSASTSARAASGFAFGDDLGVATPLPALTQADAAQRWTALLAVARRTAGDRPRARPSAQHGRHRGPKAKEAEAFGKNCALRSRCPCTSWTSASRATRRNRPLKSRSAAPCVRVASSIRARRRSSCRIS